MSLPLELLLCVAGVFRVSRMVAKEDGFFDVFLKLRQWIFKRFNNGWVNMGVNCVYCVSWWLSFVPAILVATKIVKSNRKRNRIFEFIPLILMLWQGIAGLVALVFALESYLRGE